MNPHRFSRRGTPGHPSREPPPLIAAGNPFARLRREPPIPPVPSHLKMGRRPNAHRGVSSKPLFTGRRPWFPENEVRVFGGSRRWGAESPKKMKFVRSIRSGRRPRRPVKLYGVNTASSIQNLPNGSGIFLNNSDTSQVRQSGSEFSVRIISSEPTYRNIIFPPLLCLIRLSSAR